MNTSLRRSAARVAVGLAAVAASVSCASDTVAVPRTAALDLTPGASGDRVSVCHEPTAGGSILSVSASALSAHLAHGDYVATLLVSHATSPSDEGVSFRRIGDALAAARDSRLLHGELTSAACRITIFVSADTYRGTVLGEASGDIERFPLIVDVPDITLRGALAMGLDDAGRATGVGTTAGETVLSPVEPLPVIARSSTPIVLANAHPGGAAGHGLVVEGFVFESGHDATVDAGGQGVLSVRAERFVVRGNRFGTGFSESVDVRAGSGVVSQNYLGGIAGTGSCDICLAGPGSFMAVGNRLLAGGIPGIVASGVVSLAVPAGVEPLAIPATAETWAEIRNNEVRDHLRVPEGTGIRVDAVGTGAPNVHNTVHAIIQDNLVVNNRFGMLVHGGFPVIGTDRMSDVDVTYGSNVIRESCQAKLLVALARHQTVLGLNVSPFLLNSTFRIELGGDLGWSEAWFGHDAGYGNTLVVDGQTIANGNRQFYSASTCPGL